MSGIIARNTILFGSIIGLSALLFLSIWIATSLLRTEPLTFPSQYRSMTIGDINPAAKAEWDKLHGFEDLFLFTDRSSVTQTRNNRFMTDFLLQTIINRGGLAQIVEGKYPTTPLGVRAFIPPTLAAEIRALEGAESKQVQKWVNRQSKMTVAESEPCCLDWELTYVRVKGPYIDVWKMRGHSHDVLAPAIVAAVVFFLVLGFLVSFAISVRREIAQDWREMFGRGTR